MQEPPGGGAAPGAVTARSTVRSSWRWILKPRRAGADAIGVTDVARVGKQAQPHSSLRPNRISISPVEPEGFGVDFTYHGATGHVDAETAERVLAGHDLRTQLR